MLIKQLYFSHTGLVTKGNSCMKIFPPSVLKLVSWAKLTAPPIPSPVQVVFTVGLGFHVGAQQARVTEAALLTSKKRCIILKQFCPPPERSAPHGKRGCALLGNGEGLNQLKKGGLKSCPFLGVEGGVKWGMKYFFLSLVIFHYK